MSMSEHSVAARIDMPLTNFIVALYKMTPAQRLEASAAKAAARYGLPRDLCQWWITEAQRNPDRWPIRGGTNVRTGR